MMMLQLDSDPLRQLHDIVAAPAASWWPLAWGWWLLLLLLGSGLVLLMRWLWQRWQRRRWQRLGLQLLQTSATDLRSINQVLKRVCLQYFDAASVAPLQGKAWATFLLRQLPAEQQQAWQQRLPELLEQLYRGQHQPQQVEHYQQFAQLWLRHALPPAAGGADV